MEKIRLADQKTFDVVDISTTDSLLTVKITSDRSLDALVVVFDDATATATITLETEEGGVMATMEGYTDLQALMYEADGVTVKLAKAGGIDSEYIMAAKIMLGEEE